MKDWIPVIVAALGVFGAIFVPIYNKERDRYLKKAEEDKNKAQKETQAMKIELRSLKLIGSFAFYKFLNAQIEELFEKTNAVSIIFLFAVNGTHDFNHVTSFLEISREDLADDFDESYINIPIDLDYKKMLKQVEKEGLLLIDTNQLTPGSLLCDIYSQIGISHSCVNFLGRKKLDAENDILLFYSIRKTEPFTHQSIIRIITERIKTKISEINIQQ